jgi:hypothetical protein
LETEWGSNRPQSVKNALEKRQKPVVREATEWLHYCTSHSKTDPLICTQKTWCVLCLKFLTIFWRPLSTIFGLRASLVPISIFGWRHFWYKSNITSQLCVHFIAFHKRRLKAHILLSYSRSRPTILRHAAFTKQQGKTNHCLWSKQHSITGTCRRSILCDCT